jgi:hypothetical protein
MIPSLVSLILTRVNLTIYVLVLVSIPVFPQSRDYTLILKLHFYGSIWKIKKSVFTYTLLKLRIKYQSLFIVLEKYNGYTKKKKNLCVCD